MLTYEYLYFDEINKKLGNRLENFYYLVKNKAPLDLKNQPYWREYRHFIYNGEVVDNDVPGNIVYGYMGKVLGLTMTSFI
ncbi:hypothetical protein D3C86_1568520 [compost metagenome]